MAKPDSQWYRLDNAGILYSALQREEYSAIYRFSALMTEPVRPAALQNAIDRVLPRFPSFAVRIRRGLFWYYLEPNTAPGPFLKADVADPCQPVRFREDNGWKFNLLTEDIQFSTAHIIRGDKIGYCKDAVLYDEQPVTFKASWNQRLRWTKGFYQVFARYGKDLVKGIVLRHSFQCYDMLMVIAPATLLTLASLLFNGGCLLAGLASGTLAVAECAASGLGGCLLSVYFSLLAFGIVTLIAEQKQIHCSKPRQILYLLMFPVFIFTYIPMAVVALRKNVTWKHIPHSILCTADQICEKK